MRILNVSTVIISVIHLRTFNNIYKNKYKWRLCGRVYLKAIYCMFYKNSEYFRDSYACSLVYIYWDYMTFWFRDLFLFLLTSWKCGVHNKEFINWFYIYFILFLDNITINSYILCFYCYNICWGEIVLPYNIVRYGNFNNFEIRDRSLAILPYCVL